MALAEKRRNCPVYEDILTRNRIQEVRIKRNFAHGMTHGNDSGLLRTSSGCIIVRATFEIDGNPTVQVLNCILTIPTSLTASLANLLVVISIWRTPSLHTPSNVLLVSLSLSDLGVGLVSQPIFLAFSIVKIKGLADMFCSSTHALSVSGFCLSGASLLTLTAISLDRFIAIHLHLRYSEIVTVKRVTVIVIVAWFALILSATSIFWAGYTLVDYLSLDCRYLSVSFHHNSLLLYDLPCSPPSPGSDQRSDASTSCTTGTKFSGHAAAQEIICEYASYLLCISVVFSSFSCCHVRDINYASHYLKTVRL